MNLGKRIVTIRKERKMSQEDFAELFNVTRQTISSWENSKSYPDIETIVKISDKFNISLDILLREDKNMIETYKNDSKQKKIFRRISIILTIIIIIIVLAIIGIKYNEYLENEKIEQDYKVITQNIKELGFKKDNTTALLLLKNNNITYAIEKPYSNEKYDITIYAYSNYNENKGFIITNKNSKISVYFYEENIDFKLNSDGTLYKDNSSEIEQKLYTENEELIMNIVEQTNQYKNKIKKGI